MKSLKAEGRLAVRQTSKAKRLNFFFRLSVRLSCRQKQSEAALLAVSLSLSLGLLMPVQSLSKIIKLHSPHLRMEMLSLLQA